MTTRGETLLVTLVLVFTSVILFGCFIIGQHLKAERLNDTGLIPPLEITCQEDMPCWDCTSMGNKECGR